MSFGCYQAEQESIASLSHPLRRCFTAYAARNLMKYRRVANNLLITIYVKFTLIINIHAVVNHHFFPEMPAFLHEFKVNGVGLVAVLVGFVIEQCQPR